MVEELRSKIRECSAVYLDLIGKTRGVAPLAYLEEFMAGTGYEAACQRLAPQLLDETRGMAEGAGISFLEAFAMQTIDEEWVYARNKSLASATAGGRCSAAGYVDSSGNYAVLAQNMDIGRWCDGFQVLLNHRHSNGTPDSLILSIAGSIGLCGLNSAGIGPVYQYASRARFQRQRIAGALRRS